MICPLYEHYTFTVDPKQSAIRIDKFLVDRLANATRNKIQNAISSNYIEINGKRDIKSNYKVRPNDIIKIFLPKVPKESEVIPENICLDIVYEDESLMVINKPANMVVHPAYNNWSGTLVNALVYHFQNLPNKAGNVGRPGLVHRIDKDTSGLLVIAKTEDSMTALSKQFAEHTIERKYITLVWGDPTDSATETRISNATNLDSTTTGISTIDTYLIKDPKDRRVVVSKSKLKDSENGKRAITHYRVIKRFKYCSLLECTLETGRTHQIRAHMKYIGHPIFGDKTYGGDTIVKGPVFSKYKTFVNNCFKIMPYQALHAKSIGFVHPQNNNFVQFTSEIPANFAQVLEKWEKIENNKNFYS